MKPDYDDESNQCAVLIYQGAKAGLSMKVMADLLVVCRQTLRHWRQHISEQGLIVDHRKGAPRKVAHKFTVQEG
jgi:transposase